MAPPPITDQRRFLWHHRLHEEWGKEQLYFWRLAFQPTYDGPAIMKIISSVMAEKKILSFAVYEMTGHFDVLIRIWLPVTVTPAAFDTCLHDHLSSKHLHVSEAFHVTQIEMHWIWRDLANPTHMRVPFSDAVNKKLSDQEISKINEHRFTAEEETELVNRNLIAPIPSREPTIKFLIEIPQPNIPLSRDARDELKNKIIAMLAKARKIRDISLYYGSGFSQYLILAGVAPTEFDCLKSQLIDEIATFQLGVYFRVRPYTHMILSSPGKLLPLQDKLPIADIVEEEDVSVEKYLVEVESATLEFKGSAFVDLRRYLLGDGQLQESNEKVTKPGVLKGVVGLLNGRGGKLIIGVLEADKFSEAREKTTDWPKVGSYIVCGTNLDYQGGNWDAFQLKIQSVIKDRITPSPSVWVTVKKQTCGGRDVCVISVREPAAGWFYVKDDPAFYLRDGNNTRPLGGPEANDYKSMRKRGS